MKNYIHTIFLYKAWPNLALIWVDDVHLFINVIASMAVFFRTAVNLWEHFRDAHMRGEMIKKSENYMSHLGVDNERDREQCCVIRQIVQYGSIALLWRMIERESISLYRYSTRSSNVHSGNGLILFITVSQS